MPKKKPKRPATPPASQTLAELAARAARIRDQSRATAANLDRLVGEIAKMRKTNEARSRAHDEKP